MKPYFNRLGWLLALPVIALAGELRAEDASKAGDVLVEPATLHCLGLRWPITGDENENAVIDVHYRKAGQADWRQGLPLFRTLKEATADHKKYWEFNAIPYSRQPGGRIFAGRYFQWTIGHNEASGKFSVDHGYNGSFVDRGNASYLEWINQFKLRFYCDHTAGKGDLFIQDSDKKDAQKMGAMRTPPINEALKTRLQGVIQKNIGKIKSSPYRSAYSLDDEISWSAFCRPCMWKVTDSPDAYKNWLEEIYGKGKVPERSKWISYDDILAKLPRWTIGTFDASPLMDQLTFNDSVWNNFLGDLVEYANSVDPEIPCGYVGGQGPNAFGGYDYAKIMRKVQFLEVYNMGSAQEITRSFNPRNAIHLVKTHFHRNVNESIWQPWYYVSHGNRGAIGWVLKWFDENKNPESRRHTWNWEKRLAFTSSVGVDSRWCSDLL